jgi:hypothetical protein
LPKNKSSFAKGLLFFITKQLLCKTRNLPLQLYALQEKMYNIGKFVYNKVRAYKKGGSDETGRYCL